MGQVQIVLSLQDNKLNLQENKLNLLGNKLAATNQEVQDIKMQLVNGVSARFARLVGEVLPRISNNSDELKLLSEFTKSELKFDEQKRNITSLRLDVLEDLVSKLWNSTLTNNRNTSVSEFGTSIPEIGSSTGNDSSRPEVLTSLNDQLLQDLFNEVNNIRDETASAFETLNSKVENCSKNFRTNFEEETKKMELENIRQDLKKLSIMSMLSSKSKFLNYYTQILLFN